MLRGVVIALLKSARMHDGGRDEAASREQNGRMREDEIDKERGDDATGREGKKTRVKPNQIKELMATEENE